MGASRRFSTFSTDGNTSQDRSTIEKTVAISRLTLKGSGTVNFSNRYPLNCPPWARGAYGGQLVAQSLLAAYETVPTEFAVHSIHSHFINAVNVETHLVYETQRFRDGKSFATRVVHALQNNIPVYSATVSFSRYNNQSKKVLRHMTAMPKDESPPKFAIDDDIDPLKNGQSAAGQAGRDQPCDCVRSSLGRREGPENEIRLRQWMKARGKISHAPLEADSESEKGVLVTTKRNNHHAHVAALAYMTDNYFIGAAYRTHNASRFSNRLAAPPMTTAMVKAAGGVEPLMKYLDALSEEEKTENRGSQSHDEFVDMVATLDHVIYFHRPRNFRADEWILLEMESPWADDERGFVTGRIWSHEGHLVASCMQEGVIRLSQENNSRL